VRRRRSPGSSAALAAAVLVVSAAAVLAAAGPAEATAYRFWTYWHGTAAGGWTFSPVGAGARPADGTVEGWRFTVSDAAGSRTPPRATASFDSVCGGTPAVEGRKRVGLVVDFGTAADAPPGQQPPRGIDTYCAVVTPDASGYRVLQDYAAVRAEAGLVCAIAGYPTGECGAPVAPSARPSPSAAPPTATSRPQAQSSAPAPAASASAPEGAAGSTPSTGPPVSPPGTDTATPPATSTPQVSPAAPTPVAVAAGGLPPTGTGSGGDGWVAALVGVAAVAGLGAAAVARSRRGEG
jgi:hypothetical protein